jgi:putative PIN family toxin of toxin-antitoxin system
VVDTNIFVSLLIRPDSFAFLIDYFETTGTLLYSSEVFSEFARVLRRKKFLRYSTLEEAEELLNWIDEIGELVLISRTIAGSRDLSDNKFLELAVSGKADYLITGDKDLLVLGKIESTPIVSPADFLRIISH